MAGKSVFINSKKSFEARNPDTGELFKIPKDFIGLVPYWVTQTAIFKLAVKGLAILIPATSSDADIRTADAGQAPAPDDAPKKKAAK